MSEIIEKVKQIIIDRSKHNEFGAEIAREIR